MCKHKRAAITPTGESYDGTTTKLSNGNHNEHWHAAQRFPWWTIWLIWPLLALLKGVSASVIAGWTALGELAVPANVLLALALIAVGIVLLVRARAQE